MDYSSRLLHANIFDIHVPQSEGSFVGPLLVQIGSDCLVPFLHELCKVMPIILILKGKHASRRLTKGQSSLSKSDRVDTSFFSDFFGFCSDYIDIATTDGFTGERSKF